MSDESLKYYELLGVAPGSSMQELKTAHRDLAKVWHPDRFAHDPRLQQKAQDKLKEINEAYDRLLSGKTGRQPQATTSSPPPYTTTTPVAVRRRRLRNLILPLSYGLAVVLFFAAACALVFSIKRRTENLQLQSEQAQAPASEERTQPQSVSVAKPAGVDSTRSKQTDRQSSRDVKNGSGPTVEGEIRNVRPMPTVTLTIDPMTGMLATADCPNKSRMTYPSGMEPRAFCNAHHKPDAPEPGEQARPKESRLKSFVKRYIP
ncbi:MAG TPA: J domain-containing protein [Pyrinomonadaceae bacterium]|nr:J domain-containing protein [Pyrinomonadaceae bacterium]